MSRRNPTKPKKKAGSKGAASGPRKKKTRMTGQKAKSFGAFLHQKYKEE